MKIRTILVPTDFSVPAEAALQYAAAFARHFGAAIVLMHAVEPIATPEFYPSAANETACAGARERLDTMSAALRREHVLTSAPRVAEGAAWDAIARTAEAVRADIIIIATHGYTGLKHVLLGSTAERVVRHARCPVLVIPGHAHPGSRGSSPH